MTDINKCENPQRQWLVAKLAKAKQIHIGGYTNEMVTLTPPGASVVEALPKQDGIYYHLSSLTREVTLIGQTSSVHTQELIALNYALHAKRESEEDISKSSKLFVAYTRNDRNAKNLRLSGPDVQETFKAMLNTRDFAVLPLCSGVRTEMYFRDKHFFTTGEKWVAHLEKLGYGITPVQQICGMLVKPQSPEITKSLRTKLTLSNVLYMLLATVAALLVALLGLYIMSQSRLEPLRIAGLLILICAIPVWYWLFIFPRENTAKQIISAYKAF